MYFVVFPSSVNFQRKKFSWIEGNNWTRRRQQISSAAQRNELYCTAAVSSEESSSDGCYTPTNWILFFSLSPPRLTDCLCPSVWPESWNIYFLTSKWPSEGFSSHLFQFISWENTSGIYFGNHDWFEVIGAIKMKFPGHHIVKWGCTTMAVFYKSRIVKVLTTWLRVPSVIELNRQTIAISWKLYKTIIADDCVASVTILF